MIRINGGAKEEKNVERFKGSEKRGGIEWKGLKRKKPNINTSQTIHLGLLWKMRTISLNATTNCIQVEAMLGKFSLDTIIAYGGMNAGLFLIIYLFTMIVMIMNFFIAILNDFLAAVANSKQLQSRDYEVMDHFVDTVRQLIVTKTDEGRLTILSYFHTIVVIVGQSANHGITIYTIQCESKIPIRFSDIFSQTVGNL